jgi:phospholipid/cholesterol/gamma-HCH transport system permease protein
MGFYTKGGAEGVGRSTTLAVVISYVAILVTDFMMTAVMF